MSQPKQLELPNMPRKRYATREQVRKFFSKLIKELWPEVKP